MGQRFAAVDSTATGLVNSHPLMLPSPLCSLVGQRLASLRREAEKENHDRQDDIWQERNSFVDDFDAGLPGVGKVNRHDTLR